MNAKEYEQKKTLVHQIKRRMDALASELVALTVSSDPNQALMVMTLIGQRLIDSQIIRQARGVSKIDGFEDEAKLATSKTWKLESGLKPNEVKFGENVMVVSDLLAIPHKRYPGKPGMSLEERYTLELIRYRGAIEALHEYEDANGLERMSFNMSPNKTNIGRPKNLPIERIEKKIGDEFSRMKNQFLNKPAVKNHMGRKPKKPVDFWDRQARSVVGPRQAVMEMDSAITDDTEVIKRAIALNDKISSIANFMITNSKKALSVAVTDALDDHVSRVELPLRVLTQLEKKIKNGQNLTSVESRYAADQMKSASERRYLFYVDNLKAMFPIPFSDPNIAKLFDQNRALSPQIDDDLAP